VDAGKVVRLESKYVEGACNGTLYEGKLGVGTQPSEQQVDSQAEGAECFESPNGVICGQVCRADLFPECVSDFDWQEVGRDQLGIGAHDGERSS
jgi:hypothetical protein